jgi:hypothetical protein
MQQVFINLKQHWVKDFIDFNFGLRIVLNSRSDFLIRNHKSEISNHKTSDIIGKLNRLKSKVRIDIALS